MLQSVQMGSQTLPELLAHLLVHRPRDIDAHVRIRRQWWRRRSLKPGSRPAIWRVSYLEETTRLAISPQIGPMQGGETRARSVPLLLRNTGSLRRGR
jgi:hypothetical protein